MVIRATPKDSKEVDGIMVPVNCSGTEYVLQCTGLYSATTRRQIGWFLAEYFGNINFYHVKEIAGEKSEVIIADLTRDIRHFIEAA